MSIATNAILDADAAGVRAAVAAARAGLVDRETLIEVLALAAVAGEHVLVIGPPGTAKSQAVRSISQHLGGRYFEYLVGRFTEPNEIFGPVDLRRLRDGVVEVDTTGMLPEADVAFLDEVFLGSTAILNTLLGILNERTFRRGRTAIACPLRLCVGASNVLPEDPQLAAFADRFLVHLFVDPLADARLEDLLEDGWAATHAIGPATAATHDGAHPETSIDAIDRLASAAMACDLTAVRPMIGAAIRRMRAAGIPITDRRAVRAQHLVAAAAVLDGRTTASANDVWPLPLIAPTIDAQALARETLADLLAGTRSPTLPHASEDLSRGPLARAERMVQHGRALLAMAKSSAGEVDRDHRLRLEAALREIDAAFTADSLPAELAGVRAEIVAVFESNSATTVPPAPTPAAPPTE